MIIVRTATGTDFINEKTIQAVSYVRREKKVMIYDKERELAYAIEGVESIVYASDSQTIKWVDE